MKSRDNNKCLIIALTILWAITILLAFIGWERYFRAEMYIIESIGNYEKGGDRK